MNKLKFIAAGLILLLFYHNNLSQTFTDVANDYGVADIREGSGVMWLDYDKDNDLDIVISCDYTNEKSRLFRNDGNQFVDVAAFVGFGYSHLSSLTSVCAGDYDNNGYADLLIYSDGWSLLKNDINGSETFINMGGTYQRGVFIDYDNDGDLDIYEPHQGGANKLYRNEGDGSFTEIPGAWGLFNTGWTRSAIWGDYDNDGDMDLYVVNGRYEKSSLYRNDFNTSGFFIDVTDEMGVGNDYGGYVLDYGNGACWADYDNDGDLDLYLITLEENRLFRNEVNTNGFFVEVGNQLNVAGPNSTKDAKWGDYDNDGDLDLYVMNDPINILYRNDISDGGVFVETGEMANSASDYSGGSWGDFDKDGNLDFYLATTDTNRLYHNNGNNNNWINIELEGTVSNASAIGAMAHLYTGGIIQTRFVETSSGFGSQNSLALEFGLGGSAIIDSIIIEWPSGITNKFENINVNQFIKINEEIGITDLKDNLENIPIDFKLEQNYPNPFNPTTKIQFSIPIEELIHLKIHDLLGNEIATLLNEYKSPGNYDVEFNASNLPSGIYFYKLTHGKNSETKKMMLLK